MKIRKIFLKKEKNYTGSQEHPKPRLSVEDGETSDFINTSF
jgi:hypothetical protein